MSVVYVVVGIRGLLNYETFSNNLLHIEGVTNGNFVKGSW
jgi:hypothetical protein